MKVVKLSALRTGRLYPPANIPGTHFCWRLSQPQGHIAAGMIMSMKNFNETIRNRTRDLPATAVSQPTAPPDDLPEYHVKDSINLSSVFYFYCWAKCHFLVPEQEIPVSPKGIVLLKLYPFMHVEAEVIHEAGISSLI